ncbi:hypothetical protein D9M72_408120 [compost metagenome]
MGTVVVDVHGRVRFLRRAQARRDGGLEGRVVVPGPNDLAVAFSSGELVTRLTDACERASVRFQHGDLVSGRQVRFAHMGSSRQRLHLFPGKERVTGRVARIEYAHHRAFARVGVATKLFGPDSPGTRQAQELGARVVDLVLAVLNDSKDVSVLR